MDDNTKQLLALGREHYEKREFDKAEHYLVQVIEEGVSYADVHNMVGVVRHDRGAFEDAMKAFEAALAINPTYTEALLNLSVTYNDLGRYDQAKETYKRAMSAGAKEPGEIDPFARGKIANLHAQVAQAYHDVGMLDEAIRELRKAVYLGPDFADLRLRLANVYREKGDLESSRFELQQSLESKPAYVPARVALGVVLLAQGNKDAAIAEWTRALDDDPGHRAAKMYLRMADSPALDSLVPPAPDDTDDEPTKDD